MSELIHNKDSFFNLNSFVKTNIKKQNVSVDFMHKT
jgi:hypothetical protein